METQEDLAGASSLDSAEQKRESFKVFIGFDSSSAQAEALSTAQYVRGQLADDFEVAVTSWDLAYLGSPRLRERAATEAAGADMIIVSAREGSEGMASLKPWIAQWKGNRNRGGALIALIHGEPAGDKCGIFGLLEKTAEAAAMDFIAKYCPNKG